MISDSKRARPYWPGRTSRSGLGKVNCTASVPVVGSTARSIGVDAALLGVDGAVGEEQLDGGLLAAALRAAAPRPRRASRRYSASLMPARKRIGSTCETVVSSVLSPRPTRLPAFTCVVPTSPSIGDVMWV